MKEISAGGIVYRQTGDGVYLQLILDRYGKFSFPKGKIEPGETLVETALREIAEETGIQGRIKAPLGTVTYRYHHPDYGVIDKEVHYYLVEASGGENKVQMEEIAGVQWVTPQEAWNMQKSRGYENNDDILQNALRLLDEGLEKRDGRKF